MPNFRIHPGDQYDRALKQLAQERMERQARERDEMEAQGLIVYRVAVHGSSYIRGGSRFEQVAADSINEAKTKALKLPNVVSLGGLVQRLSEQPTLVGVA
jgi:hypothetical protein